MYLLDGVQIPPPHVGAVMRAHCKVSGIYPEMCNKCSAVAEMGDRLATTSTKMEGGGGPCPFGGGEAGFPSNTM